MPLLSHLPPSTSSLLLPTRRLPSRHHHHHHHRPLPLLRHRHLRLLHLRSSSSSSSSSPASPQEPPSELPIFPLPLVLFPGAILPLQIFEFRYRIMMHTLLHSDLRFGVLFSSSDADSTTAVGCVAEVLKHEKLADDRFFLIAKGQERFRINKIIRSKPYLVADVTWLEDRPPSPLSTSDGTPDLETLTSEVETLMKDVIRISNRLDGKKQKLKKESGDDVDETSGNADDEERREDMDLRRGQFPTMFSFFVGSTFEGAPREQQALLEMEDTAARLKRERDTLRNTLNYLTAAAAVRDAFPQSPSSSSS